MLLGDPGTTPGDIYIRVGQIWFGGRVLGYDDTVLLSFYSSGNCQGHLTVGSGL